MSTGAAQEIPIPAVAPVHARTDPAVIAAIVVTTLLWASAFVAIRSVRGHYGARPLALGRLVVASR